MSITGKAQQAFTLLELLCVILIIGALLAFSVPAFRQTSHSLTQRGITNELNATFHYLRQRAIVEEEPMCLIIDHDAREWRFYAKSSPTVFKRRPYPEHIGIETTRSPVTFYPDGTIDQVTVRILSPHMKSLAITTQGVYGGSKIIP